MKTLSTLTRNIQGHCRHNFLPQREIEYSKKFAYFFYFDWVWVDDFVFGWFAGWLKMAENRMNVMVVVHDITPYHHKWTVTANPPGYFHQHQHRQQHQYNVYVINIVVVIYTFWNISELFIFWLMNQILFFIISVSVNHIICIIY